MSKILVDTNDSSNAVIRHQKFNTIIMNSESTGKTLTIRPNSPRTKEAILLLGLEPNFYEIKNIDTFGGPDVSEEIKQLKYQHYKDKLKKLITEVICKRKELIRWKKTVSESDENLKSKTNKSFHNTSKNLNTSYLNSLDGNLPFIETYNKTISYLKASHTTPNIESSKLLLKSDDRDTSIIEEKLEEELEKFNKMKNQKQKEAKSIYEDEIKRLKTIQEFKEKEERIIKLQAKFLEDKKHNKEKMKEMAKIKLEKNQIIENQILQKKKLEKDSIKKKLEKLNERQIQLLEEKENQRKEIEAKTQNKHLKLETLRQEKGRREMEFCLEQKGKIEQKMSVSKEIYDNALNEKLQKIKNKLEKNVEISNKNKSDDFQYQLNKFVEKMIKKTESLKILEESKKQDDLKKKHIMEGKENEIQSIQSKLKIQKNKRTLEILEREKKIDKGIEMKKKYEEETILKKQEIRKIKEEDKNQNYNREKRKKDYHLKKMMNRQKRNIEKLNLMKSQQEILKLARLEVSIQSRIEKNRISQSIEEVQKILNSPKLNSKNNIISITDREKNKTVKILKTLFNDEEIDLSLFQIKSKDKNNQKIPNVNPPTVVQEMVEKKSIILK